MADTAASWARTVTVLLVEDNAILRVLLEQDLRANGLSVVAADGSRSALNMMEQEEHDIDIVLTGVRLQPGEPNGMTLGRMLGVKRPDLPVIYMTGDNEIADRVEAADPELMLFRKPFVAAAVAAAIRRLVDRRVG